MRAVRNLEAPGGPWARQYPAGPRGLTGNQRRAAKRQRRRNAQAREGLIVPAERPAGRPPAAPNPLLHRADRAARGRGDTDPRKLKPRADSTRAASVDVLLRPLPHLHPPRGICTEFAPGPDWSSWLAAAPFEIACSLAAAKKKRREAAQQRKEAGGGRPSRTTCIGTDQAYEPMASTAPHCSRRSKRLFKVQPRILRGRTRQKSHRHLPPLGPSEVAPSRRGAPEKPCASASASAST